MNQSKSTFECDKPLKGIKIIESSKQLFMQMVTAMKITVIAIATTHSVLIKCIFKWRQK